MICLSPQTIWGEPKHVCKWLPMVHAKANKMDIHLLGCAEQTPGGASESCMCKLARGRP